LEIDISKSAAGHGARAGHGLLRPALRRALTTGRGGPVAPGDHRLRSAARRTVTDPAAPRDASGIIAPNIVNVVADLGTRVG